MRSIGQTWNNWTRQEGEYASEGWSGKYIQGETPTYILTYVCVYFLVNLNVLNIKGIHLLEGSLEINKGT